MCASVNLPVAALDAELIVVELVIGELSASLATAGAHCPKLGERRCAVVVRDVQRVLLTVWLGAGEHVQNTQ